MSTTRHSFAYFLRIFALSFGAHSALVTAGCHLSETYRLEGDSVLSYLRPYSSFDDESMTIFTPAGISIA